MTDSTEKTENMMNNPYEGLDLLSKLFKHKWFIIITVIVSTAASIVIAFILPKEYKSTVNIVPPKMSHPMMESGASGISSALKSFGMSKLGGEASEGYDLLVILKSRTVVDSVIKAFDLTGHYEIEDSSMQETRLAFEENIDVALEKTGNYTVSVWDEDKNLAAEIANEYVNIVNHLIFKVYREEAETGEEYLKSRIISLDSSIIVVENRLNQLSGKTMMFSPEDQAQSASKALSELKANLMETEVLYELSKNSYGENDPYTLMQKELLNEIRKKVNEAETQPGFVGNFPLKSAAKVGAEYMRLIAEFETLTKVKSFLTPMYEKYKLDMNSVSKMFFVVDAAIPAEKKDRPKRSLIILGGFFGAFIVAAGGVAIAYKISDIKRELSKFNS